ncbi:hypothetical protein M406DRAFT_11295, partial [Cryphonectria parasitica EP155]
DLLVMATNNSSIVSKRSVERLYYPNEPHFFRFFVNKFQRRAPLINRGYHLRLHVIDCWTRYPEDCTSSGAVFVDIDFPHLIQRKRQVVLNTPELMSHLSHVDAADADPHVFLRSDRYYQVGCDLRQTATLEATLGSLLNVRDCLFMFVAEVSITYMETDAADSVIQWAGSLGQAEFCLLEQILPDGPDHPFASTMTGHFDKLSTPIKSVTTYPTIPQQCARFRNKGWSSINAQSLWSAWSDETFLTPDHRRELDHIEPFDEWEEFVLFGSHYVLLHAKNYGGGLSTTPPNNPRSSISSMAVETHYSKLPGQHGLRRFGKAMLTVDALGHESIFNCLGLGSSTRLPSYDIYTRQGRLRGQHVQAHGGPSSRMCFTLTDIGQHGVLLTGGRSSPAKAMSDCWLFKQDSQRWERTHNLAVPLYRHSACRLASSSLALVFGGRSGATGLSDLITVYHPERGWLSCLVGGSTRPDLRFGATLACCGRKSGIRPVFYGFVAGGLSSSGTIVRQTLAWNLTFDNDQAPIITFTPAAIRGADTFDLLSRFGASYVQDADRMILIGGVGSDGIISRVGDITVFTTSETEIRAATGLNITASGNPRPLLIGSSAVLTGEREIVILGGAATCFSMGTFWTKSIYTLSLPGARSDGLSLEDLKWQFVQSGEIVQSPPGDVQKPQVSPDQIAEVQRIRRVSVESEEAFEKLIADGLPVILERLNLGPCLATWSLRYLTHCIGERRKVVVHESQSKNMDFNAKNFRYTTMDFGEFAKEVESGRQLYLRALSADAPADQAASLERDFPMLTSDFILPDPLRACKDNLHSSILRISGPVNMWLHYDVQANVYCQISGSKRMVLFPPSDITHLSFAPGASSSSIDVFSSLESSALASTHPMEADLNPGDILYIPPLWLHTAEPTASPSIAVNVFFRSLDPGNYAVGRDVYGNRDLGAYDRGRQDLNRIVNAFGKVPDSCKQFYLLRLAEEL